MRMKHTKKRIATAKKRVELNVVETRSVNCQPIAVLLLFVRIVISPISFGIFFLSHLSHQTWNNFILLQWRAQIVDVISPILFSSLIRRVGWIAFIRVACSADESNGIPKRHKNLTDFQYSNWERKKRQTFYNVNLTPNWQLATFLALSKSVCTCVSDWLTSWHTHTARRIASRANLFVLRRIHCVALRVFVRHAAAIAEIDIVIYEAEANEYRMESKSECGPMQCDNWKHGTMILCCGSKSRRCRRRPYYNDMSMVYRPCGKWNENAAASRSI